MKKENYIICEWASPQKLNDFIICNQFINFIFVGILYLFRFWSWFDVDMIDPLNLYAGLKIYFTYFYICYGLFVGVLGILLVILSRLGSLGGIDRKRTIQLLVFGIINIIQAGLCIIGGLR